MGREMGALNVSMYVLVYFNVLFQSDSIRSSGACFDFVQKHDIDPVDDFLFRFSFRASPLTIRCTLSALIALSID